MEKKSLLALALVFFVSVNIFADTVTEILKKIKEVERDLKVTITVTGTTRTVQRQAELMANMSDNTLQSLYAGSYVNDMINYRNATKPKPSPSQIVQKFVEIINKARAEGSFVSRHLSGEAVDIAPSTSKVRSALESKGLTIKDETETGINCWHIQ